jgi:hypothetical protein
MGKIIDSSRYDLDYGDMRHSIKPLVRQLLENYSQEVWPLLSEAIATSDPHQQYRLTEMLGAEDDFERAGPSVLSAVPDTLLREWCVSNPEVGPRFVAGATEVLVESDEGCQLSPRAKYLLDEFGDSKEVRSALSANMGTFSWSGSVVPYYEKEIIALEPLLQHGKQLVREWADRKILYLKKQIKIEKIQDAEEKWGIR